MKKKNKQENLTVQKSIPSSTGRMKIAVVM